MLMEDTGMPDVRILPAIDSDEMAEANRQTLDIGRTMALRLADETLAWCDACYFMTRDGKHVNIRGVVAQAIAEKRSIPPDAELPSRRRRSYDEMRIQVVNETTTVAAKG